MFVNVTSYSVKASKDMQMYLVILLLFFFKANFAQSADVFMLKYGDRVISNFYFNEKMSLGFKWAPFAPGHGQQIIIIQISSFTI